jgi:hypothetical protein
MPSVSTLLQWLGEQIVPLFLIGFAILMGLAMVYISAKSRRSALAQKRSGRTEENFAEQLATYGFDPEIARSAYRYLQQEQGIAFPIEPMDDLDRDLGLDNDEVNTSLRDLLAENNREYLPGLVDSPLVTVVDLIRFVQASPRRVTIGRRRRMA